MSADTPYLFSIAALSVSLAGFAGLVAAFRRGTEPRPVDIFRLRQIAEFGFASALLALLPIPLAATLGDPLATLRAASVAVFVYGLGYALFLVREGRRIGLSYRSDPLPLVVALNGAILGMALAGALAPSAAAFEWALLFLLARPMLAFVLVLTALGQRS